VEATSALGRPCIGVSCSLLHGLPPYTSSYISGGYEASHSLPFLLYEQLYDIVRTNMAATMRTDMKNTRGRFEHRYGQTYATRYLPVENFTLLLPRTGLTWTFVTGHLL